MKKLRIAILLTLLIGLLVVGSASALQIVSYDDTASEIDHEYGDNNDASLICNGNFDLWNADGTPECWEAWADTKSGWEEAHLAEMDYAYGGEIDGEYPFNNAMGFFVRNVGGSGPFWVGAYNALDNLTEAGYYWVEVHATMWGGFPQIQYDNGLLTVDGMLANSVAFYGFGTSEDPASVGAWHELFPVYYDYGVPGAVPCPNPWEECYQLGRYETVYLDPAEGDEGMLYLHLQAGQKFSTFNVWTVFGFDDILIVPADAEADDLSGWWLAGAIGWDQDAAR